jgi:E3 ubiquitin-protein ligase SHPRH
MQCRWRRIVLDECQNVRASTTTLAQACEALKASRRWMVSGTPLHGSVDDLNGELLFLGVWPFSFPDGVDGFWEHRIGRPWEFKAAEVRFYSSTQGKCEEQERESPVSTEALTTNS